MSLVTLKASLVLLYLRIFGKNTTFRRWVIGTLYLLVFYGLVIVLLSALRCTPISATFIVPVPPAGAKCLSLFDITIAISVLGIVADIWILILPIPQLWKLNMSVSKKIQLFVFFDLGVL